MPIINSLGYSNPLQTGKSLGAAIGVATLSALIAKLFSSSINIKSHLVYGTIATTTATLIWENRHLEKKPEKLPENVAMKLRFLMNIAIPLFAAKKITSYFIDPISYKNALKRGVYLGGMGTIFTCGYATYQRRRET